MCVFSTNGKREIMETVQIRSNEYRNVKTENVQQQKNIEHSQTGWILSGTRSSRYDNKNVTEIMNCAHELV